MSALFRIAVDDAVLADLPARMHHTRRLEAKLVDEWSPNVPRAWCSPRRRVR